MGRRVRKSISVRLRNRIYARDSFACVYCGDARSDTVQLSLDHVDPHARGGPDTADNLVTACTICNGLRATFPVRYFAMYLRDLGRVKDPAAVEARVAAALARPLPAQGSRPP